MDVLRRNRTSLFDDLSISVLVSKCAALAWLKDTFVSTPRLERCRHCNSSCVGVSVILQLLMKHKCDRRRRSRSLLPAIYATRQMFRQLEACSFKLGLQPMEQTGAPRPRSDARRISNLRKHCIGISNQLDTQVQRGLFASWPKE